MATDDSIPRVSGKCGTAGRRADDMAKYVGTLRLIPNRITEIFRLNDPFCGLDSTSNINKYRGCLLGGKSGRCVGLTTFQPSSCAECLEILAASTSWSLRVCPGSNGIALALCTVERTTSTAAQRAMRGPPPRPRPTQLHVKNGVK
jgi:hypothetical protein